MDGIADKYDDCPAIAGTEGAAGCPDEDGDGVADKDDLCLGVPGSKPAKGCPDQDYDGVPDDEDLCPYLPGTADAQGCRDTDKDGIYDHEDQCPYEKGVAGNYGCPVIEEKDSDNDGVLDKDDKCPNKPGPYNGCPDTDGDGLSDDVDDCPELAGARSNTGCPELSQEDKSLLESAINNVKFQRGSYTLLSSSGSTLNQIADLMRRYPTYHLKIEGYTDNQGDDEANVILSENRAKACLDYLHKQGGIAEERMSYEGFGKANPRATNETQSGRRQNRRVEFKITPN
jgi:OOP family OmpA-OmpF porin